MFDYLAIIRELGGQRFCCSQIMIALGMELKGNENRQVAAELVRAMNGLCGGMGDSAKDCGALTGGACMIGLICGRGEANEDAHEQLRPMVHELVEWFEDEYGSVECSELAGTDLIKRREMCPGIVQATFENAVRIMLENGIELA